jgi:hypothetical protein
VVENLEYKQAFLIEREADEVGQNYIEQAEYFLGAHLMDERSEEQKIP